MKKLFSVLAMTATVAVAMLASAVTASACKKDCVEMKVGNDIVIFTDAQQAAAIANRLASPTKRQPTIRQAKSSSAVPVAQSGRCGGLPFKSGTTVVRILPCTGSRKVSQWAPGLSRVISGRLVLLQSAQAQRGCLWVKKIRPARGNEKVYKGIVVDYVVPPALLYADGTFGNHGTLVAAFEAIPGSCAGVKSKAMSIGEILALAG